MTATSWQMHWIEGADHSFHVLKSSGRDDAQVMTEVADVAESWVAHLADVQADDFTGGTGP